MAKEERIRLVIALAFLFTLLASVGIGTASANTIYVNESGWWIDSAHFNTSSTPIQSAINTATAGNLIYVYNGSYTEHVNVNKPQLTLQGEGADVVTVVPSPAYNAFYVTENYVNISEFTVTGTTQSGFYLYSANHCNISDNNASGNYFGVHLVSSNNNTITNNNCSNSDYGIYQWYSDNNTLLNNTANTNRNRGIYLGRSSNNSVCGNTVGSNRYTGIFLHSSSCYNDLFDNVIYNNSNGFWLSMPTCNYNRIHDNRVFNHIGDHGSILSHNRHAIRLYNASYNQVYNNTIYSNHKSITIWSISDYNDVYGNNVTNNTLGMYVEGYADHISSYNKIHDNLLDSNNGYGISVSHGIYNAVYSNTLRDNEGSGIYLQFRPEYTSVWNNTIDSSGKYGIGVSWTNNSSIYDNRISNSSEWDVHIYQQSFNNTFTNNQLLYCAPTTVSFTHTGDVAVKGVDVPPSDPDGWLNISRFVNVSCQSGARVHIKVSYNDSDVTGDESTLLMWKYISRQGWFVASNTGVDTVNNYVHANTTGSGIYVPLVNNGGTIPYPSVHNVNTSEAFYTIQDAIDAVNTTDGHIIEVGDGTYPENVNVNKRLTIRSENGSANCIVSAANPNAPIFDIHSDGVTICGITATTAANNAGIYLDRVQNCNISSNNCTQNYQGIYLYHANNNTIADNIADSNKGYGIRLYYSDNNRVINNSASFSEAYLGIRVYKSDNNSIVRNRCNHNNWEGIRLYYSNNSVVEGNNASYNGGDTLYEGHGIVPWRANNTRIQNNTLMYNGYQGIYVYEASNNTTITNNDVSHNTYHGIYSVMNSSNLNITGNRFVDNGIGDYAGYGIYLREGSGAIVSANHIADNAALNYAHGIKAYAFTNLSIHNNTIVNNSDYGVLIDSVVFIGNAAGAGADTHPIEGDSMAAPLTTLVLLDENHKSGTLPSRSLLSDQDIPGGINVTENRIMDNAGGIRLKVSDNVTITGNNVTNNGIGINLTSSNGNTIYNNYFDNTNNAWDDGTNVWNITPLQGMNIIGGSWLGGNYWSDYAGVDTGGDGLGDTMLPYNSSGGIQQGGDGHPLTAATLLPDLEITGTWVCWPDNCTICYNVTNTGNGAAFGGYNITLFVDGVEVARDSVQEELTPGEKYTGCFDDYIWTYTPPEDIITVCADNNNTVKESNETYNCLNETWKCGDVDMDGDVGFLGDVRGVARHYMYDDPIKCPWAGDIDCDGYIDFLGDARGIARHYMYGEALNCCCEQEYE